LGFRSNFSSDFMFLTFVGSIIGRVTGRKDKLCAVFAFWVERCYE
jgi:hypothetical protein